MTRIPLRVLAIENSPAEVELSVAELARAGYEVHVDTVDNPDRFAALLDAGRYDVVLADYRLPEWTGMDFLPVLKGHAPDLPMIMVTGTLGEERAVECVKQGVADYVLKQNLARLPMAVRRAIDDRQAGAERRRSEDMIRKLTLAVDQGSASVIITDLEARVEYVNRRFTQVTGLSREEVIGQTPRLWQSGRTPIETYQSMWQTIRAGRVWRGEILNRRKNGELFWDAVTISPIRDSAGQITHFLATQEDVTGRKEAIRAIEEREERFRQIAENINEVFFVVDAGFEETLYISPAYEEIWGRSCQSVYDDLKSFLEPVAAENRNRLLHDIAQVQKGEPPQETEFRVTRPDGQVRIVSWRVVPIRNDAGEVYRICGVVLDITTRREAQVALEESEARLKKITDASFDGIYFAVDGVLRELNAGLLRIFGYESAAEVIGRPLVDFVAEESLPQVSAWIAAGMEGSFELVGRRKDGTKVLLEATTRNHEVDGHPGRVTALRDITEKRSLEDQFRQAQKMEAVGRLASGVAHDFNNLLTVIIGYVDLLLLDLGSHDPRRSDLEQVRKAADTATSLTRQLLAFSRQQVIQPRLVTLEEVVGNAEKMLKRLVGEDITLTSNLQKEPVTIKIDPGQLEQVILNLIVNSRDAMPNGGKVTIETRVMDLDDAYARSHWPALPGPYAMLSVSDTGSGMDEATRARIFEPFFTTKELGKGTGLGLATVYGIVKQNGGFIWVYSEPGQGTTFKIYFPLQGEAEEGKSATDVSAAPTGSETILVVEDSAGVRGAVRQILERLGYHVLEATSGKAAMDFAGRRHRIDLLLTDVVMPEMSGRVLAERYAKIRPETRVLYMSGYTDDAVVRHGILESGIAFVQKPFTAEALGRKVREVLDAGSKG